MTGDRQRLLASALRSTTDLVVFILATFVATVMAFSVVATFVFYFLNPDSDIETPLRVIFDIITVIVGALVGFIGGKAAGRVEEQERQNGNSHT